MIRKINFPKTSNKYFLNLENKCFDFCNNGKPANIVVFIGRNGSGKSSLLKKIFINLCYEKRNTSLKIVEKIQGSSNYLFLEHDWNGINYLVYVSFRSMNNPNVQLTSAFGPDIYDTNTTITIREKFLWNKDKNNIKSAETSYSLHWTPSQTINDQTKQKMREQWIFIKSAYLNIKNLINDEKKDISFINKIGAKLQTTIFHKISEKFKSNWRVQISDDGSPLFLMKNFEKTYDFNLLSQGEKQFLHFLFNIFLLKPKVANNEEIFFYDELETSLHNELQKVISSEIINFSDNFIKKQIRHQIFISTHSPFILEKFLNRENAVIIDVENNGENIVKNKNLLCRYKEKESTKLVYDEVLWYYYHIPTTNYFIMLYEKIKCVFKKDQEILDEFKKMNKEILVIQCIDDKLKNSRLQKINEKEYDNAIYKISQNEICSSQSSLTRFRNLLAHFENEFNYKVFKINNDEKWWNKQTKKFYDEYEKNFNNLLNQQIVVARDLLLKSNKFKDEKDW